MTWTRLDDAWSERLVFEDMPYHARWHYIALIQFCSRNSRYDGVLRRAAARRCSDVDDPDRVLTILAGAGLVQITADTVTVLGIDEYVPPPYLRDERRKQRQRTEKQRSRLHKSGDHSMCLPDRCIHAVSADVSTDTGTGQDGPRRDEYPTALEARNGSRSNWHAVAAGYDD